MTRDGAQIAAEIEALREALGPRRRREERFRLVAACVVVLGNATYLIEGGEHGFRTAVVILLTVIAVMATRP